MKKGAGALVLLLLVFAAALLRPSSTPPAQATDLCASTGSPFGPFDLQAYEAKDWRNTYGRTLELAAFNKLFPELPGFALPKLERGPRSAGSSQTIENAAITPTPTPTSSPAPTPTSPNPYIPPVLLKAIAWLESTWVQADWAVPYGEVGPVLVSPDCGYGIMQVTTGMQNISGVPNLEQAMIGGHYAFNIARGARILADKWNLAPEYRPLVGDRNPTLLEDWYYAVWGYNGFAFKNHPLNPDYPAWPRVPYSCGPQDDGFGHDRSQYPYQELVLGCVARPPVVGGSQLWNPQEVHLPDISNPAFAGPLSPTNWNACSLDLDCAAMDIPTPNPPHSDPTTVSVTRSQVIGDPALSVSPGSLSLVALPDDQGPSTSVAISNAGTGVLAWRLSASASWVKLSRVQGVSLGSNLGGRSESFTVWADAKSLLPGTHGAQITVESLYASGAPLNIGVTLRVLDYQAGTLLRGPGPAVFVLQSGLRRHVINAENFIARGFSWEEVVPVPDSLLNSIPLGQPLLDVLATGNLLKGSAPEVYVMENGKKRHVVSAQKFLACGYAWDAILTVPDSLLNSIATGSPLSGTTCPKPTFADGTLLQGSDQEVWFMAGGKKRPVSGPEVLSSCGYQWGNINRVADGVLAGITEGPPLPTCTADGSLLRGSGPDVFILQSGLRRPIGSQTNFIARGFSLEEVVQVPDSLLNSIPLGQPLLDVLATGNLLKGSAPEVYVMENGKKRHVVSVQIFSACGYGWDSVLTVPDALLNSIATGSPLSETACPKPTFADGTLLQGSDQEVWFMAGGKKRPVSGPEVLSSCGYQWGNINRMADGVLAGIPEGPPLPTCTADGSLLRGSGPAVFVLQSGLRRHVINAENFIARGFSWEEVVPVPDSLLNSIPLGQPLLDVLATGNLLKGSAPEVYVMENGKKRHVVSVQIFSACGYGWDSVPTVPDALLNSIPTGQALDKTPCPGPTFVDGTLLQGSGPKVWFVAAGKKRWITSPEVFLSCGYQWGNVNRIADSTLAAIPQGEPLASCTP